ncbi:hypothetical protein [Escherichia phage vB_EcoP_EP32B]|nr:hypothetical protein [Escherichia phage vB_EcoP_EP32B]
MVQMRHSVTLGDDGAGGNMVTVDNDNKLVVITSHSRISPNYRMQLGQLLVLMVISPAVLVILLT